MTTPLICGTVIRGHLEGLRSEKALHNIPNMAFNRKLRMMRADVFALLSISTTSDVIGDPKHSQTIKAAALKFLEGEFNERVDNQEALA